MTKLVSFGVVLDLIGRRVCMMMMMIMMMLVILQSGRPYCQVQAYSSSIHVTPSSSLSSGGGGPLLRSKGGTVLVLPPPGGLVLVGEDGSTRGEGGDKRIVIAHHGHSQNQDDIWLAQDQATAKAEVAGTLMEEAKDHDNNHNPCLGASGLSLQVQLWCEYYHGIGLI